MTFTMSKEYADAVKGKFKHYPASEQLDEWKRAAIEENERRAEELREDKLPKEELVKDKDGKQKRIVKLVYNTKTECYGTLAKKYKTKMCQNMQSCNKGSSCTYAHSEEELRKFTKFYDECLIPYYEKAKNVSLDHAELCHNQQCPVRLRLLLRKTVICKYWKESICYKGRKCVFAHGNSELVPLPKYELCKKYQQKACNLTNDQCVYAHGKEELRDRKAVKILPPSHAVPEDYIKVPGDEEPTTLCSLCSAIAEVIPEEARDRYIIIAIDKRELPIAKGEADLVHVRIFPMQPPNSLAVKPQGASTPHSLKMLNSPTYSTRKRWPTLPGAGNEDTMDIAVRFKPTKGQPGPPQHVSSVSDLLFLLSKPEVLADQNQSQEKLMLPQRAKIVESWANPIRSASCPPENSEQGVNEAADPTEEMGLNKGDIKSVKPAPDESDSSEDEDESEKVDEELESILDEHHVEYYQILHISGKKNLVEISGCNVTSLKEELTLAAKKFNFTAVAKDLHFATTPKTEPASSNWMTLCQGNFTLASTENPCISMMEIIVQAKDQRRKRDKTDYFGVTTAHSFLSEEDTDTLMTSSANFQKIFHRLAADHAEKNFFMNTPGKPIDFSGNPLPLYRHWRREGVTCEWSALQDVALIKLDREEVLSDSLLKAENFDVHENQHRPFPVNACLRRIRCKKDARKLKERKILCRQKSGVLTQPPKVKEKGYVLGVHLAFTLDNGERLGKGDCGSAVYLNDGEMLPMIGMFFGCLKTHPHIHQAAILDWNLMLVTETPELMISEIRLAEEEELDNAGNKMLTASTNFDK